MKKKVLFALIALLSFVSAWAAGPALVLQTIGENDDVWIIPQGENPAKGPGAKVGDTAVPADNITYFDADQKLVTAVTTPGWYFARVMPTGATEPTYLRFQAWKAVQFEFIDNKASFDASVNPAADAPAWQGGLKLYYEEWIPKQTDPALKAAWEKERDNFEYAAGEFQTKYTDEEGFPWVVFKSTEAVPCRVAFVVPNENPYAEDPQDEEPDELVGIYWQGSYNNNIYFSTLDAGKKYGVISTHDKYGTGQISYDVNPDADPATYDAVDPINENIFDPEDLTVYFIPAALAAPELELIDYAWTMTPVSKTYTGYAIDPEITVTARTLSDQVVVPEYPLDGSDQPNVEDDPNYIVKYFTDQNLSEDSEVDEMIHAGEYYVQVYLPAEADEQEQAGDGPGQDQGDDEVEWEPLGDPKKFTINKKSTLSIDLGQVHMKYGDDETTLEPKYRLSGMVGDDEEDDFIIEGLGYIKRGPSYEGVDLQAGAVIGYTTTGNEHAYTGRTYKEDGSVDFLGYEDYNTLVITNNAQLVTDPGELTITFAEGALGKQYGDLDPTYTFTKLVPATAADEADETVNIVTVGEDKMKVVEGNVTVIDHNGNYISEGITITRPDRGIENETTHGEAVGEHDLTINVGSNYNYTVSNEGFDGKFTIAIRDITNDDDATYAINFGGYFYNGANQYPEPTSVKFYHKELKKTLDLTIGVDYNLTKAQRTAEDPGFANNKDVTWNAAKTDWQTPAAECDILGIGDNFTGKKVGKFLIKPLTVNVACDDASKAYSAPDPALFTATYTGWLAADAEKGIKAEWENPSDDEHNQADGFIAPVIKRTEGNTVGTYNITVTKAAWATNYEFTYAAGTFTITGKTLTITAKNASKAFGEDDPDFFDYDVDGWVEEDDFDKTQVFFERVAGEAVESYAIKAVASAPAKMLDKYAVTYVPATFTISAAEGKLFIIAEDNNKTYGQEDPTLTYHAELCVGYDGDKPIFETYTLSDADKANIVIKRKSGEDATRKAAGYDPEEDSYAQTWYGKSYYEIFFPERTVVTPAVAATATTPAVPEVAIDRPAIIGGYVPEYVSGKFNIDKQTLHVKVVDQSIKFGNDPAAWDIELANGTTELQNGDSWTVVKAQIIAKGVTYSGYPIYEVDEDGNVVLDDDLNPVIKKNGPGTYAIEANGKDTKNYIVDYADGTLTVTAGGLTIWALTQNVYYPEPLDRTYTKPAAKLVPVAEGQNPTIAFSDPDGVIPQGFDFSELVELSCTATKVGTNEKAITIKLKDGIENYLVTLENPAEGTDNGAADLNIQPLTEIHLAYANVAQALEDHKGQEEMTVFLPNRKLTAGLWYTFSLPFEFRVPDLSNKMYYGVADILDEAANDGNFHFVNTSGRFEANQPFLYKAEAADEIAEVAVTADELEAISFTGVTIAAEDEDGNEFIYNDLAETPYREDAAGNKFIAQYTGVAKADFAADERVFGLNGEGGYQFGTPTKAIAPTVAFIGGVNTAASADVRIFIQEADGTVTEISAVDAAVDAEFAEGWYTITGIKLDAKPTEKGVYIYNGKKVSIQ